MVVLASKRSKIPVSLDLLRVIHLLSFGVYAANIFTIASVVLKLRQLRCCQPCDRRAAERLMAERRIHALKLHSCDNVSWAARKSKRVLFWFERILWSMFVAVRVSEVCAELRSWEYSIFVVTLRLQEKTDLE
jgi:hypothetical protein